MASALGNDPDAQVLKVRRLAAGGKRIRTVGPILTRQCQNRDGSPFVTLGGSALERARKPPKTNEGRRGLGSGGCAGGSRFDPPHNVRSLPCRRRFPVWRAARHTLWRWAGFQRPAANPTEISRKGLTSTPLLGKNQPPAGRRFNQAT